MSEKDVCFCKPKLHNTCLRLRCKCAGGEAGGEAGCAAACPGLLGWAEWDWGPGFRRRLRLLPFCLRLFSLRFFPRLPLFFSRSRSLSRTMLPSPHMLPSPLSQLMVVP